MEWISTNALPVISGLATLIIITSGLIQIFKDQRLSNMSQHILKLKKLGVDKNEIDRHIKEYEMLFFNKVYKTNLSYERQTKLKKFHKGFETDFSLRRITNLSKYLNFKGDKITIKFRFSDYFDIIFFSFCMTIFFSSTIYSFYALYIVDNFLHQMILLVYFIICFFAIVFIFSYKIHPFLSAKRMRKKITSYSE